MKIKIKPDIEKAKSMMNSVLERERFVLSIDIKNFPTMVLENYYEIIRELGAVLISMKGIKFIGENAHKDLICFLLKEQFISENELSILNNLRLKRNKSYYEGQKVEREYIENNVENINRIIKKLKLFINSKLRGE